MTRDEFMKHAEQEIEQAFRGQRNRMINLVEQAWAEGKRNAEIDTFTAAGNELLNVIKKELFPMNDIPSAPSVPLDKLCEWLDKNNDFVPFCADDKADCNSCELEGAECIKKRIMLWMEEQDAAD